MKERFKKIMNVLYPGDFFHCRIVGIYAVFMYYDLPQIVVILPIIRTFGSSCSEKVELFAARNDDIDGSGISAYRGSAGWPWLCGHFQNNDHFEDIAGGTFVFVDRNRGRIACSYGISQRPPYQSAHFILRTWGVVWHLPPELFCSCNPLYPFVARHQIHQYAQKYDKKEYPVSDVVVYYSYTDLQYLGRVVMSDGVIYPLSHDMKTGEVKEERN